MKAVRYYFYEYEIKLHLSIFTYGKAKHGIGLTHKPGALFIQYLRVKK